MAVTGLFAANGSYNVTIVGGAVGGSTSSVGDINAGSADSGTSAPVKIGGTYNSTLPTYTDGQRVTAQFNASGILRIIPSGAAGDANTATAGDGQGSVTGLATNSRNQVYNSSTWDRQVSFPGVTTTGLGVAAAGMVGYDYTSAYYKVKVDSAGYQYVKLSTMANGQGTTAYTLVSAATTNATSVKGSTAYLHGFVLSNSGASAAYVKFYSKASAPTVGTDTPIHNIMIPAGGTVVISKPLPDIFSAGIAFAVTGGPTIADTTAVALSQVIINLSYV